ncbi:GIY-YIG nuclease family protein [uncultured Clostridium sp.]|uniref:GIY-YIG nuclease family protein n=1 Tax=uncultured Clostridium sp. TaxID=59620 RepID=UPI00258B5337|nr:GIY-YIG nuclease family protein [uncultured Clostridium sp.]
MKFINYNVFDLKNNIKKYNDLAIDITDKSTIIKEVKVPIEITVERIPSRYIEYDIDDIKNINKHLMVGFVYQLEMLTPSTRTVYIGSTKHPEERLNDHKNNLKSNEHHNKDLQKAYNRGKLNIEFKFSLIDGVKIYEASRLRDLEHHILIDAASKYHNRLDSLGRKITVVYSH